MMYGAEDVSLSSFNHHRSVHIFQLHIFSLQAISQAVDKSVFKISFVFEHLLRSDASVCLQCVLQ